MHPNNRYRAPHDFPALARTEPALAEYFIVTPDGRTSLDFTDPRAVRLLNGALLRRDFGLRFWDIPRGSLCPGVPGRLDYVHALADLIGARTQVQGTDPEQGVIGLDIGTGASLIYPILGSRTYGWRMVGVDTDPTALRVAAAIVKHNPVLHDRVIVRRQPDPSAIFRGIIEPGESFTFTMCNPPFFASAADATAAARRKWDKLGVETTETTFNFGGQPNELWTPGGEPAFLRRMIAESTAFAGRVAWFTTLVSKKGYLRVAEQAFGRHGITDHRVIKIGRGGKQRRILCWRV